MLIIGRWVNTNQFVARRVSRFHTRYNLYLEKWSRTDYFLFDTDACNQIKGKASAPTSTTTEKEATKRFRVGNGWRVDHANAELDCTWTNTNTNQRAVWTRATQPARKLHGGDARIACGRSHRFLDSKYMMFYCAHKYSRAYLDTDTCVFHRMRIFLLCTFRSICSSIDRKVTKHLNNVSYIRNRQKNCWR